MIPESNWPCHYQYGYHAVPDDWAGRYNVHFCTRAEVHRVVEIMKWISTNIKNYESNIWWVAEYGVLYLAFRKKKDLNWFILKWS